MEFLKVIENRRSIRQYSDRDIPDSLIIEMMRWADRAPSAGAIRGYSVVVVRDDDTKRMIYSRVSAPVFLVICTTPGLYKDRYGERGTNLYSLQDATIYTSYLQLVAVNLGLSTVWLGAFKEDKVSELLGLNDRRPIAVLAVGYEG